MAAERSYPESEVRGGSREELSCIQGQGRLGGDTPRPRSGAAGRSHLAPEARAGGREEHPEERWLQKGLAELSHVEGQEWWR